jgi:hypothetical protein
MKIDNRTYKDRQVRQIVMTADQSSVPEKVLFFADAYFLFLIPIAQMAHCLLPHTQANASQKSKSHFFFSRKKINLQLQTIQLNSYGNN